MKVPDGERGAALLAVLLLVAVMGAISATGLSKLRLSTSLAANSAASEQARAFATGLESLVTLTIDDLMVRSPDRTTLAGGWHGAVRRYPLPGGGIAQARVTDGGNCFNLNSLVQGANGTYAVSTTGVAQFTALMQLAGVGEGEATRIASAAADWADSDSEPMRNGAEDQAYAALAQPYRAANTLFSERSELRAVAGVTPDIYARLRPFVCALPVAQLSPLNVNTLLPDQAPLLAMLDPINISIGTARRIIAERPQAGWADALGFMNETGLTEADIRFDPDQIEVKTNWLSVDLEVGLAGSELIETALVDARRSPSQLVVRRWGVED